MDKAKEDYECRAIDIAQEIASWQPTWAQYLDLFDRHLDIGLGARVEAALA